MENRMKKRERGRKESIDIEEKKMRGIRMQKGKEGNGKKIRKGEGRETGSGRIQKTSKQQHIKGSVRVCWIRRKGK